jgi:hypothetical protein
MRCAFTKRRLRDHLLGLFVAGGGKCKKQQANTVRVDPGDALPQRASYFPYALSLPFISIYVLYLFSFVFFLLKQEAERGQLLSSSLCYLKAVKMGQWVTRLCASPLEDMSTWTCYFHVR